MKRRFRGQTYGKLQLEIRWSRSNELGVPVARLNRAGDKGPLNNSNPLKAAIWRTLFEFQAVLSPHFSIVAIATKFEFQKTWKCKVSSLTDLGEKQSSALVRIYH